MCVYEFTQVVYRKNILQITVVGEVINDFLTFIWKLKVDIKWTNKSYSQKSLAVRKRNPTIILSRKRKSFPSRSSSKISQMIPFQYQSLLFQNFCYLGQMRGLDFLHVWERTTNSAKSLKSGVTYNSIILLPGLTLSQWLKKKKGQNDLI